MPATVETSAKKISKGDLQEIIDDMERSVRYLLFKGYELEELTAFSVGIHTKRDGTTIDVSKLAESQQKTLKKRWLEAVEHFGKQIVERQRRNR